MRTWFPFTRDRVLGSTPPKITVGGWVPPKAGLLYMLLIVTVTMGAIFGVTMLGSVASPTTGLSEPAVA